MLLKNVSHQLKHPFIAKILFYFNRGQGDATNYRKIKKKSLFCET